MMRRALHAGIGEGAFWHMSPAAVILLTSGKKKAQPWAKKPGKKKKDGPVVSIGSAADCP